MSLIAKTPEPPYYAVLFSSIRKDADDGYSDMAERMISLAQQQPGFLGIESARDDIGITVSYWTDLEAIKNWKQNMEHREAQKRGRENWYAAYKVRIAKVERDYEF